MTNPNPDSSIQALQARIDALEASLSERMQELAVYQAVQQAINRQLDRRKLLQMIADQARALTTCEASVLYLLEGESGSLQLEVISGALDSEIRPGYRMPLQGSVAGMALRDKRPYCVQNAQDDNRVFTDAVARSNVHSFLIAPLISGETPLGVISAANKIGGPFQPEDERILSLLASSVVISLENSRLYEQAGEIAVMNERNRLARELHDSVTQILFSTTLTAEVLPVIWDRDPKAGRQKLVELRELTRGALAEMRTLLMELRPDALADAALPDLLRHLINAFIARARVHTTFEVEGDCTPPVDVKIAFYRIAQEALGNITRHSEASQVSVILAGDSKSLRLSIHDNGQGFDPGQPHGGDHHGLRNMRERAAQAGIQLTITSGRGQGTTVALSWSAPGNSPCL